MRIVHDADGLRPYAGGVLVPTMGALHAGHVSLIEQADSLARDRGGHVIVSVFVNPTQFNDPADFARYPRTLEADAAVCAAAGASCVFAPSVETVYPSGVEAPVGGLPAVATEPGLEDAHRPGHFAGVCQVVRRLFALVRPSIAVFGEKDWQQLQVVAALTRDDRMPIEIIGRPTVREPDGLAMSSRNRFLGGDERRRAVAIHRSLLAARGAGAPAAAEAAMRRILGEAALEVDYAVVRDAASLAPRGRERSDRPMRALIAARVGGVRLIDNMAWR